MQIGLIVLRQGCLGLRQPLLKPLSCLLCTVAGPHIQATACDHASPVASRRPLFWAGRAPLTLRDCLFCAVSGLRGSISLILAQAVVTEVPAAVNSTALVSDNNMLQEDNDAAGVFWSYGPAHVICACVR